MVSAACLGQPSTLGMILPRHVLEGKGGVTAKTGHGLMRVTFSVILALSRRRTPRRRRGDITIRSVRSSFATWMIRDATGPNRTHLLTDGILFIACKWGSRNLLSSK